MSTEVERSFEVIMTPRHERMPFLPFVPAIRTRSSDLIFVSGMIGTPDDVAKDGLTPPGDIRIEAERILSRLSATLTLAGSSLADVVRITKYMTDLEQHDAVVEVMRRFFVRGLPTSTTVEVRRLVPKGFGLEIDAVAAVKG